jgi:hypothetical protein
MAPLSSGGNVISALTQTLLLAGFARRACAEQTVLPRPARTPALPGQEAKSGKGVYSSSRHSEDVLAVRARGGIGRREGLRILWSNPCRFDPCRAHQQEPAL